MGNLSLVLAAEFGGGRFGPYPAGTVSLGSDAAQCHVALNPALGLLPVHAWLAPDARGQWWLQPADAAAVVFLLPGGRAPGKPLQGAAMLGRGDAFALGGAAGPRFTLELDPARPTPPRRAGRGLPTGDAMAAEVQRQLSTRAMTHGPVAELVGLFYRARSGSLFQPRYLVSAAIALVGAAVTGCAGLAAFLGLR